MRPSGDRRGRHFPQNVNQLILFDFKRTARPQYLYLVVVTNMEDEISTLGWFYNQRAGAENLIKQANNDAGLAAHLSGRWATNCVHFQVAMLAYT